jgi:hypothetical protein
MEQSSWCFKLIKKLIRYICFLKLCEDEIELCKDPPPVIYTGTSNIEDITTMTTTVDVREYYIDTFIEPEFYGDLIYENEFEYGFEA